MGRQGEEPRWRVRRWEVRMGSEGGKLEWGVKLGREDEE